MDNNDLHQLARHLEERGLQVTVNDDELRLSVSNPLNSRLTEEIIAADGQYVTSFAYEIGERGSEAECAERIAHVLGAGHAPARGQSA